MAIYTFTGLCSGAGGLDLGFELAGFRHQCSMDIEPCATQTLRLNRPHWQVLLEDLREFEINQSDAPDVLLAGIPCQGFSLGGNRIDTDPRNQLYRHVARISESCQPRIIVIENVLNLRKMKCPVTQTPFIYAIAESLKKIGYQVFYNVFKMCEFGVPQTRRRFVFVAFRERAPVGYHLPLPDKQIMSIRNFLYELANDSGEPPPLANHHPCWGFKSSVHHETGEAFDLSEEVIPVRFSRTASDGNPIRSFDLPFPAIDTATVWGWAQGKVSAVRKQKNRDNGQYVRNPDSSVRLWRISASRLRSFTDREYARLQTFPDDWKFVGSNKREIHKQIGNAVPVEFARRLGQNLIDALECLDSDREFLCQVKQLSLF